MVTLWLRNFSFLDLELLQKSEALLAEVEAELVALDAQCARQLRRTAVEHGHFALALVLDLLEHLVPVRTTGVRPRLQTSDQVAFLLQKSPPIS